MTQLKTWHEKKKKKKLGMRHDRAQAGYLGSCLKYLNIHSVLPLW